MPDPENGELKELVVTDIWPWIDNCQSQHEDCAAALDPSSIPTRLIDVGLNGEETVKLVQTGDSPTKDQKFIYLTLSYCWGKGDTNSKARTTAGNLKSRLCSLNTKDLPMTIQDAITITRLMGVTYLWVDAMCIIQPEGPYDQGDWKSEAGRMGGYYSGALCCIAASCASSSEEGFLRPRPLGRYKLQEAILPLGNRNGNEEYLLTSIKPSLTKGNHLETREWCLQERILSPRVLHWTWAGLFRECRSAPPLIESQQLPRDSTMFKGKHILSANKSEALTDHWSELVNKSSGMNLTYLDDRMPAIWGIASILSKKHQDEYSYGIFRSSLAEGLLWESFAKSRNDNRIPSWSWMSMNGQVTYNARMERSAEARSYYVPLIRNTLPQSFPTSHGLTGPGNPAGYELELEAPLVTIILDSLPQGSSYIDISGKSPVFAGGSCAYVGSRSVSRDGLGFVLTVLMLHRIGKESFRGLALSKKHQARERIGLLEIEWPPWEVAPDLSKFMATVTLV